MMKFKYLAAIIAGSALLTACKNNKKENVSFCDHYEDDHTEVGIPDKIDFRTFEVNDSIIHPFGNDVVKYRIMVPVKDGSVVVDSIRRWIDNFVSRDVDAKGNEVILKGSIKEKLHNRVSRKLKEYALDGRDGEGFVFAYESNFSLEKEYENDEFVTMKGFWYEYTGGAHGMSGEWHKTFRKKDGHIMGWDLLEGMPKNEILRRIKKGLMKYFEVSTESELNGRLQLSGTELPLPSLPPYLTEDGVRVIYGLYEIACYADGMPTCIVAKKPLL